MTAEKPPHSENVPVRSFCSRDSDVQPADAMLTERKLQQHKPMLSSGRSPAWTRSGAEKSGTGKRNAAFILMFESFEGTQERKFLQLPVNRRLCFSLIAVV